MEAQIVAEPQQEKSDKPVVIEYAGKGAQRAAALLLGLGPEVAGAVFRLFSEQELRQIALGAKLLRKANAMAIPDALSAYVNSMDSVGGDAQAGDEMLREFVAKSVGHDVSRRAFDGVALIKAPEDALAIISMAEAEALAMILQREQPQTVALLLSAIDGAKSGQVMDYMPDTMRAEILRRMAQVDAISPEVLLEVAQAVANELKTVNAGGLRKVDGKSAALEILRRQPNARQAEFVAEIEKEDPALAADLKSKLFTFEDLSSLTDRDIQALMKEVDTNRLTVALKGATQDLRDKILRNMSSRAAEMLADDLAAMGAVRLSTVEAAQAEIAQLALGLSEQGKITIVGLADKML
jgi:flagellar motor switch protein FliG